MSNDQEEQERQGFTIQDRRRFSSTGETRAEQPERREEPAPAEAPADAGTGAAHEMNFSTFVLSLSTQVLAHLGEIPHPGEERIAVELGAAKQLIDILGILEQKTAGNLDKSEAALLEHILFDLRLRYVDQVRGQRQTSAG